MRKYQDIEPARNLALEACNAKIESVNPEKWFDVIFNKILKKFLSKKEIPIVESDIAFLFDLVAIQLTTFNLDDKSSKSKLEMISSIKNMAESLVAYNLVVAEALKTFLQNYKKSEIHYDPADNPHEPYFWVNLMLHVLNRYCSVDNQDEEFELRELIHKFFGVGVEDFDYFVSDILSFRKKVKLESRKHDDQENLMLEQRNNIESFFSYQLSKSYYDLFLRIFVNQVSGWKNDGYYCGLHNQGAYSLIQLFEEDHIGRKIIRFFKRVIRINKYISSKDVREKISKYIENYISIKNPYYYEQIKNDLKDSEAFSLLHVPDFYRDALPYCIRIMKKFNFENIDIEHHQNSLLVHDEEKMSFIYLSSSLNSAMCQKEQIDISDLPPAYLMIYISFLEELFKKFEGENSFILNQMHLTLFNSKNNFLYFAKKYKKSKKGYAKRVGLSLPKVKKVDPTLKGILDQYGFNFLGYSIDELCGL